jgi:hypothetical protein
MPTPRPTPRPAFCDVVASGPDFCGVEDICSGGEYSVIHVLEVMLKKSVLVLTGEVALRRLELDVEIV